MDADGVFWACIVAFLALSTCRADAAVIDDEYNGVSDQIPAVLNRFWGLLDSNYTDGMGRIDGISLDRFFHFYDQDASPDGPLNLQEAAFIGGGVRSWPFEFGVTTEQSRVYYRLNDIYPNSLGRRINWDDINRMMLRCDPSGNGFLEEDEFKNCFLKIYRALPFGIMYARTDIGRNDYVSNDEFLLYFDYMDFHRDGQVTEGEWVDDWLIQNLGNMTEGVAFFRKIDSNADGVLTESPDLVVLFDKLNIYGGADLEFEEYVLMDLIMHDQFP